MNFNLCACMGVRPGDEYCYCVLKSKGLSTKHYEWSDKEKEELQNALSEFFNLNNKNEPK